MSAFLAGLVEGVATASPPFIFWLLIVHIVLSFHVGEGAAKRGRSYLLWAAYAILATAPVAVLSLWLLGEKKQSIPNAET